MPPTAADRLRATLFGAGTPDPGMRVSDAERAEVTDLLARHYSDGRLDQAEFDDRVTRAMAAKTYGDLRGLFDDLPPLPGATPADTPPGTPSGDPGGSPFGAPGGSPAGGLFGTPVPAACHGGLRRHRRGPLRAVATAVLVIIAANIAWHAITGWIWPGLWIIALAAVFVIASRNHHHRH